MKTCICTVIKNEQEYLDEWLKYHLDLGINHIFVFEDIDSDSHQSITDRYKDVTLLSINNVLNAEQKKEAADLKVLKRYNCQHIYFKQALNFIKAHYATYDWCFVIDVDEFITMQNPNDSLALIESFRDFDAFVLSWKCYGASGHIAKPNYTNVGVVGTYTQEIKGRIADKQESLVKTCWNMRKYKEEFFYNQHHPRSCANWVNTKFFGQNLSLCYSSIYLRHYITKSFEEYSWKINKRGFCWGYYRDYDFFFKANPDMLERKQELVDSVEPEILVVLPYVDECAQGNEIVLALSAWKKYCRFKYKFVVIGTFSHQLQQDFPWVEFVHCDRIPEVEGQYNPHLDMQHKMEVAMKLYSNKYEGFIWMVDDNYAIRPFNFSDIATVHYHRKSFDGDKDLPSSYWGYDKYKTRQLLDKLKLGHINYSTHYPCYFEFAKLKKIWDKFDMRHESYVIEDLYFNIHQQKVVVLADYIRVGIWDQESFKQKFEQALQSQNILFVCNSAEGWSPLLEYELSKIVFES